MDKYFKSLNRDLLRNERPFYIISDNSKSNTHLSKIMIFDSLKGIEMPFKYKTFIEDNEYLDNDYLRNKKDNSTKIKL